MTLSATASSGLTVTFTVVSGPATVSGATLTVTGAGVVTVEATQGGDADFAAASPVRQTFTALTAPEWAVRSLYRAALGRDGKQSEWDAWVALLPNGATALTPAVTRGIECSDEARSRLVAGWYQTYLGRASYESERQGWTDLLRSGWSEEWALSVFLSSQEFYGRAQKATGSGTADERYVAALYRVLLGRAGSAEEVDGWVQRVLPAAGRAGVAQGFLTAQEYREIQCGDYYQTLLHRSAGAEELSDWVDSGLDTLSVRVGVEGSDEFFSRR